MDELSEDSEPVCYLYVNIVGSKIGESQTREIVPSTCVKKFNYDNYKKDNNIYKNKLLKIKIHPDGKRKKCNVLYAATDQQDVMKKVNEKRFAPPRLCETLTDESTLMEQYSTENISREKLLDDIEVQTEESHKEKTELVQKAKATRKRKAEITRENKNDNEEMILKAYLDDVDSNEDELDDIQPVASTPIHNKKKTQSDKMTIRQQEIRIKHLEYQLKQSRKEIRDINNDYEERLSGNENRNTLNTNSNTACCSGIDHFKVHDKMFDFTKEQAQQELEYDENGNVHLGSQVYCNPVAYNDAFKSKKPFNYLSLLTEGVYGLEELSQRCVRKQANTHNLKVLSPTKRIVIEKKVYAFMRVKDQTLSQIDDFLDNINAHHRRVINGAKSRLEYLKKVQETENQINVQVQHM